VIEERNVALDERTETPRGRRTAGLALLAVLVVALIVVPVALFAQDRAPGDDSPEAGFLRDMMPHHSQAVEMALIIRDRTDDDQLRFMATDIVLTQQNQIGMMDGWLQVWDLSPNLDGPAMAWMDHPTEGRMPGMALPEDLEQLRTLPVDEAEVLFLQLMIRHHQGGVDMAEAYLERGDQEDVSAFSEAMIRVQDLEIETMNTMLEQRGAHPVTDDLDTDAEGTHEGH
jgi:uncharacterized protein (DUF305 family)